MKTEKKMVSTENAPKPVGPYSQGILAGDTLYCAGQIGIDPLTGSLVDGGVEKETDQVLRNLGAVLEAAGMTYIDVVMVSVFLKDMNDFATMNGVYGRYFEAMPPARQAIAVRGLPGNANVEISLVAAR
ncbi:MAG: Rid family detoxifying hydrolase [Deltaproteobacteria bacterium]|nr:Rid family detoxifying hydrolase [Deltaproteobacteria bacterium]